MSSSINSTLVCKCRECSPELYVPRELGEVAPHVWEPLPTKTLPTGYTVTLPLFDEHGVSTGKTRQISRAYEYAYRLPEPVDHGTEFAKAIKDADLPFTGTRVVNVKTSPYYVFIGKGTMWANPFFGEKDSLRKYRKYLWDRYRTDYFFRVSTNLMDGQRIGCTCTIAGTCHGDEIIALINYVKRCRFAPRRIKLPDDKFELDARDVAAGKLWTTRTYQEGQSPEEVLAKRNQRILEFRSKINTMIMSDAKTDDDFEREHSYYLDDMRNLGYGLLRTRNERHIPVQRDPQQWKKAEKRLRRKKTEKVDPTWKLLVADKFAGPMPEIPRVDPWKIIEFKNRAGETIRYRQDLDGYRWKSQWKILAKLDQVKTEDPEAKLRFVARENMRDEKGMTLHEDEMLFTCQSCRHEFTGFQIVKVAIDSPMKRYTWLFKFIANNAQPMPGAEPQPWGMYSKLPGTVQHDARSSYQDLIADYALDDPSYACPSCGFVQQPPALVPDHWEGEDQELLDRQEATGGFQPSKRNKRRFMTNGRYDHALDSLTLVYDTDRTAQTSFKGEVEDVMGAIVDTDEDAKKSEEWIAQAEAELAKAAIKPYVLPDFIEQELAS